MKRLTWRDAAATAIVAALIAPYIGYVASGSMPFVQDPEGMAATGLILGVIGGIVGMWVVATRIETVVLGAAALVLGLLVAVSESFLDLAVRNGLLAAFIGTLLLLWAGALARHAPTRLAGIARWRHPA